MTKITDLPRHERPREKLIERGPTGLRDKELLAIILRTGYKARPAKPGGRSGGKNVIEVAEEILRKFPMKKLLALGFDDLVKIKGIDEGKVYPSVASAKVDLFAFGGLNWYI